MASNSKLYTAYDRVAETTFGPALVAPNERAAPRTSTDALKDNKQLGKHCGDYVLLEIGSIDEDTGTVTGRPVPRIALDGDQWEKSQTTPPVDPAGGNSPAGDAARGFSLEDR